MIFFPYVGVAWGPFHVGFIAAFGKKRGTYAGPPPNGGFYLEFSAPFSAAGNGRETATPSFAIAAGWLTGPKKYGCDPWVMASFLPWLRRPSNSGSVRPFLEPLARRCSLGGPPPPRRAPFRRWLDQFRWANLSRAGLGPGGHDGLILLGKAGRGQDFFLPGWAMFDLPNPRW